MSICDAFVPGSIQSDAPFEGAYGNLKRLFDKAVKMYHQVKKQELKRLSPTRQRCVCFPDWQAGRESRPYWRTEPLP